MPLDHRLLLVGQLDLLSQVVEELYFNELLV